MSKAKEVKQFFDECHYDAIDAQRDMGEHASEMDIDGVFTTFSFPDGSQLLLHAPYASEAGDKSLFVTGSNLQKLALCRGELYSALLTFADVMEKLQKDADDELWNTISDTVNNIKRVLRETKDA